MRGYETRDSELPALVRDAEIGKRRADKLVRVTLKAGDGMWILIHAEIQGRYEPDFGRPGSTNFQVLSMRS